MNWEFWPTSEADLEEQAESICPTHFAIYLTLSTRFVDGDQTYTFRPTDRPCRECGRLLQEMEESPGEVM